MIKTDILFSLLQRIFLADTIMTDTIRAQLKDSSLFDLTASLL